MTLPSQKESVVEFPGQTSRPSPLTPAECDLRDFPAMFVDIQRLLTSESWIKASTTPFLGHAMMSLWAASWHQRPAASLPDSPAVLERLSMLPSKAWTKVRAEALAAWVLCDDGRLYHPVVAEKARHAWALKLAQRSRTEAARKAREEKRRGLSQPPDVAATDDVTDPVTNYVTVSVTENVTGSKREGEGDSEDKSSEPNGSAPERVVEDYDARAWSAAAALLTMDAAISDKAARAFFGKLLSTCRLRARDLLPALMGAAVNGTKDPKSYLTRAAQRVGSRSPNGKQQDVDWC